jgi:hypothetical protein
MEMNSDTFYNKNLNSHIKLLEPCLDEIYIMMSFRQNELLYGSTRSQKCDSIANVYTRKFISQGPVKSADCFCIMGMLRSRCRCCFSN